MRIFLGSILVWTAITGAVGLLTAVGWPGFVMGAGYALALWIILSCNADALVQRRPVPARAYARAAVVAVPLGYLLLRLSGENPVMWAVAFIVVGMTFSAGVSGASMRTRRAAQTP